MGLLLSKEFRSKKKIDEATSNSSLSNVRYVITEKPKWKVFKKKEVVPIPQYFPPKGCVCGNEGICKQKITPAGVTIHYPQKKKKFTAFGGKRRYKPPKIKKSKFSKSRWKSIPKVSPFQTRVNTSLHVRLPSISGDKLTNALKAIKTLKPTNHRPINKLKGRPKKFTTWRLDNIVYNSPFNRQVCRVVEVQRASSRTSSYYNANNMRKSIKITATQTVGKVATGFIVIYIQIICYAQGCQKMRNFFMT
ncbi:hypothetical protein SFRURICE_016025, partial [Spodoptera frugiperda]